MASPEYKKEVVASATDREWFGGDTLQAAIGQSYSLFTPIQLANYAATIANGGTRYKVNLIKSVRSSVDGGVVKEFNPEVVEKVDMDDEVINAVKQGMKRVVDEGSASEIFANYGIAVGGKTGTAQVGNGSNNAVFIAFAPFDDPQIAVSVVLEHGVRGTNAAQVAKDIFDKYLAQAKNIHHITAYAVVCASAKIPLNKALEGFLFAQCSAMVTNCVKTVPLSQSQGQKILSELFEVMGNVINDVLVADEEDFCASCPAFDIRSMEHQELYSRLYMS